MGEWVLGVALSSSAVQVIHMGMSASSQHCFETASWLRTHFVPVVLYYHSLAQELKMPKRPKLYVKIHELNT